MKRPQEWRTVLSREVARWSAMSSEQLLCELRDLQSYEVELDSKSYQVEVELLENTATYLHVVVAVDDGRLPASLMPLTETFIREKIPPAD